MPAGTTEATLLVTALDDTEEDPDRFTMRIPVIDLPPGVADGEVAETWVYLEERGDPAVTVSFEQPTYMAVEGGPPVSVTLRLAAPLDHAVTIPLNAAGVTEADYTLEAVTPASLVAVYDPARPWLRGLIFAAGMAEATLLVAAVDDREDDPGELLLIVDDNLPPEVMEGAPSSARVEIREAGSTVAVSFAQPTYMATEGGPSAAVVVQLSSALNRAVTIPLNPDPTGGVTAADYTLEAVAPAGIGVFDPARPWLVGLTIPANTIAATLTVTALNDAEDDPGTLFIPIVVEGLPPGVAAGAQTYTVVDFIEGDPGATVSFARPTYTATEGGSAAAVVVQLSSALNRAVTIPLNPDPTGGVTAADYTLEAVAPAGIGVFDPARPWLVGLTIPANTIAATLTVTALNDAEDDPGTLFIPIVVEGLPPGVAAGAQTYTVVDFIEGDPGATVSFARPTYTATEGGSAAAVVVQLSSALSRAVTIPLGTDHFGSGVTMADYTLEAVGPAGLTVPDPARPSLLNLTFRANTPAVTLLVTAVYDTEEDPGGVLLVIRGDALPPGVTEGAIASTVVNFGEQQSFTDDLIVPGVTRSRRSTSRNSGRGSTH